MHKGSEIVAILTIALPSGFHFVNERFQAEVTRCTYVEVAHKEGHAHVWLVKQGGVDIMSVDRRLHKVVGRRLLCHSGQSEQGGH